MVETSAQNKQVLRQLLSQPGNKTCADCKTTTHPRWASWNIGVFLCIRCSGVHRSLGTHISKVRSVDLDSWTDAHLIELQRWGNSRANAYWEAQLPSNHVPDESKIVNFIRTKYELKRWVGAKAEPSAVGAVGAVDPEDVPVAQISRPRGMPRSQPSGNLLDFDDFASAPPLPTKASPSVSTGTHGAPARYGRATPASAAPVSREAAPTPAQAQAPAPAPASAPAPAPRADLKKSILSLYAQTPQPVRQQPAPTQTPSAPANKQFDFDLFTAPVASKAPAPTAKPSARPSASSSSLLDDLTSLNLGKPAGPTPSAVPASAAPPTSFAPTIEPTTAPTTAPTPFAPEEEDDFFANPWRS